MVTDLHVWAWRTNSYLVFEQDVLRIVWLGLVMAECICKVSIKDFFLEIFYGDLCLFVFDNNLLTIIVMRCCPCTCFWYVICARVHWRMASNSHMLCPLSLPSKKITRVRSQLRSKQSSKGPPSENFLATGGFFECNTYCVMALGCLKKKEERRRWTILTFNCFRFATLK